jgi:hypothetical protein
MEEEETGGISNATHFISECLQISPSDVDMSFLSSIRNSFNKLINIFRNVW